MNKLYPLSFAPLFKYRLWGGEKLKTELNKEYEGSHIGESWEISNVKGSETKVANGYLKGNTIGDLMTLLGKDFLGSSVQERFGSKFPLLIKYIDAKIPLSIQVHPSDELAKKRHNSFGKNEMWYVMQSDTNAEIIIGFKEEITKEAYQKSLEDGTIIDFLNSEEVFSGDVFNIPAGRVHAIGAGVLLAEVQQTSDVTYRIYDYDRVDAKTGQKRELHTDLALDAIDFSLEEDYKTNYEIEQNKSVELVHTPCFNTDIIEVNTVIEKDMTAVDSFIIYMCVEGNTALICDNETYLLPKGSSILMPAGLNHFQLSGKGKILEVTI